MEVFKELFLDELVIHRVCLGTFFRNGRAEVTCFIVVASLGNESVVFVGGGMSEHLIVKRISFIYYSIYRDLLLFLAIQYSGGARLNEP